MMSFIKKLFFVLLGILSIALVIAVFLPKHYDITVKETINAPQAKVLGYLATMGKQTEWSEWVKADPNMKKSIEGIDGTVGAKYSWAGNSDVGSGSQTITALTNNRIEMDLEFIEPMAGTAKYSTVLNSSDSTKTEVVTTFSADAAWPMNLMSVLVGKPMIEKTTTQNLKNVKEILEK